MKKQYETPDVEVVKFQYSDQVVAVSPAGCDYVWINVKVNGECSDPILYRERN